MLHRTKKSRVIAGVCGGIAQETKINPLLLRIIAVVLAFMYGIGIILYLVFWLILESK